MKVLEIREYNQMLNEGERPKPIPKVGEVLVQIQVCALAVGEKLIQSGRREQYLGKKYPLPHVAGFQGAGQVVEIGSDVDPGLIGDTVVINGVLGCNQCEQCRRGAQNRCAERALLGLEPGSQGCLAEFVVLPAKNVHSWPTHVDITLAPFASELATAYHMARRVGISIDDSVVCVGAGQTGVMAIPIARMLGARNIIVVDVSDDRLQVAHELGATQLINANREEPLKAIAKATSENGADVALEMVGLQSTIELAIRSVGKLGRVGLLGVEGAVAIDFPDYSEVVIAKELRIFGCFGKGADEFEQMVKLIDSGRLDVSNLPRKTFAMTDYVEAWAKAEQITQERVLVAISE